MTTFRSRPAVGLADADFAGDIGEQQTLRSAMVGYWRRVRGGDMGSLPAILGLVVLFVVFGLLHFKAVGSDNTSGVIILEALIFGNHLTLFEQILDDIGSRNVQLFGEIGQGDNLRHFYCFDGLSSLFRCFLTLLATLA